MLAYVFWHAPAEDADVEAYEQAQLAFQRSLARKPPFGFRASASFRLEALPWTPEEQGRSYEDWYLVDDYGALGVLGEAAVGRGHRTSHDRAARAVGFGTAGLYRLIEGTASAALRIGECSHATWVARGVGTSQSELGTLLGDGMDGSGASLWQRQLVLGPAPEFCLLSDERPAGASATRLAGSWTARTDVRSALYGGA